MRHEWENRMDTWGEAQWRAHDEPWANLLKEWLVTPDDSKGLSDLAEHHSQAWWNARHAPGRPAKTALTELVWERLKQGQVLPAQALRMASMSGRGFQADLWGWCLADNRVEHMKVAMETFGYAIDTKGILNALPNADPAAIFSLWGLQYKTDRVKLLKAMVADSSMQVDSCVRQLAALPVVVHYNARSEVIPDVWHEGFLETLQDRLSLDREFPLKHWEINWPCSNKEVLGRGLREMFHRISHDVAPVSLLGRLDALIPEIMGVIPIPWWADADFWPAEHLPHMPNASHRMQAMRREEKALSQNSPAPPRRPRVRS